MLLTISSILSTSITSAIDWFDSLSLRFFALGLKWVVNILFILFLQTLSPQRNWGSIVSEQSSHDFSLSAPMLHTVWLTCLDHSAYLRWDLHSQFGCVLPKFSTGGAFTISFFRPIWWNNNSPLGAPSQEASLCPFLHLIWHPYYMRLWTMESPIAREQFCSVAAWLAWSQALLTVGAHQKHLLCGDSGHVCRDSTIIFPIKFIDVRVEQHKGRVCSQWGHFNRFHLNVTALLCFST